MEPFGYLDVLVKLGSISTTFSVSAPGTAVSKIYY